jgi:ribosome-binding factor A
VDVRDPNVTFKGVPQVSVSEDLAPKDVYVLAFVDERAAVVLGENVLPSKRQNEMKKRKV